MRGDEDENEDDGDKIAEEDAKEDEPDNEEEEDGRAVDGEDGASTHDCC